MKKKILVIFTALMVVLSTTAFANAGINLLVNGKPVMGVESKLIDSTTYVPLRAVSELLGATVEWDQYTKTVVITEGVNLEEQLQTYQQIVQERNDQISSLKQSVNEKDNLIASLQAQLKTKNDRISELEDELNDDDYWYRDDYDDDDDDNNSNTSERYPAEVDEKVDIDEGRLEYEMELKEVITGDLAWDIISDWDEDNEEPDRDEVYVLVRFEVEVTDAYYNDELRLDYDDFELMTEHGDFIDYEDDVRGIIGDLDDRLDEGDEASGWIPFLVEEDEIKDEEDVRIVHDRRGKGEVWFAPFED